MLEVVCQAGRLGRVVLATHIDRYHGLDARFFVIDTQIDLEAVVQCIDACGGGVAGHGLILVLRTCRRQGQHDGGGQIDDFLHRCAFLMVCPANIGIVSHFSQCGYTFLRTGQDYGRRLLTLASYATATGIVCKGYWHRMLRPLALYANAGCIACEIAMHAAPRSCQSGPGEKACDRAGTVSCPVARIITCCRPTGGRARHSAKSCLPTSDSAITAGTADVSTASGVNRPRLSSPCGRCQTPH